MEEASTLLNVPSATLKRALGIEVPAKILAPALAAIDNAKEVIVLGTNLYTATYFAIAIANQWASKSVRDTPFLLATDWPRYRRKNISPCNPFDSFKEFLYNPPLLVLSGLSFVPAAKTRQEIDTTLHRRASSSKPTMIVGWNMPTHNFRFEPGQELAYDTTSEYPMLHARSELDGMVHYVEVPA